MRQFSVEKSGLNGSDLNGNQCPAQQSLEACPLDSRASRVSGSVFEAWVSLLRFSPWMWRSALRRISGVVCQVGG